LKQQLVASMIFLQVIIARTISNDLHLAAFTVEKVELYEYELPISLKNF